MSSGATASIGATSLLVTIIGAGVLGLPKAFAYTGWAVGLVVLLLQALSTDYTMNLLVDLVQAPGVRTYPMLAHRYLGRWGGESLHLCIILHLFFGSVAYVTIVRDLLPVSVKEWSGGTDQWYCNSDLITLFVLILVFPVCLNRTLTAMRHASRIGVCCLGYFFIVFLAKFVGSEAYSRAVHPSVIAFNDDPWDILLGISVMNGLWGGHLLLIKTLDELRPESRRHARDMIHFSVAGVATSVYALTGVAGYVMFGGEVASDLLQEYPHDPWMNSARCALTFAVLFKLAVLLIPLRSAIEEFLAARGLQVSNVTETGIIFLLNYTITVSFGSLTTVLGVMGCTTQQIICCIAPCILHLCFMRSKGGSLSPVSKVQQNGFDSLLPESAVDKSLPPRQGTFIVILSCAQVLWAAVFIPCALASIVWQ